MSGLAQARLAEERKSFRKSRPFGFSAKPKSRPDGSVNLLVREPSPCCREVITCRQCMPRHRPHAAPCDAPHASPSQPGEYAGERALPCCREMVTGPVSAPMCPHVCAPVVPPGTLSSQLPRDQICVEPARWGRGHSQAPHANPCSEASPLHISLSHTREWFHTET